MPAVGLLHSIHRKRSNGVDAKPFDLFSRLSGTTVKTLRNVRFDHCCRRSDSRFMRRNLLIRHMLPFTTGFFDLRTPLSSKDIGH
jgi:hypothetical protein